MQDHARVAHSDQKFSCPVECFLQDFKTYKILWRHKTLLHKIGKIGHDCKIPGCDRRFEQKSALEDHGRSQHGHPKLKCSVPECGSKFNSSSKLKYHSRYHLPNYFICKESNCESSYEVKWNLEEHVRIVHLNQRLFCTFEGCAESFLSKFALWKHKVKCHKTGPTFICERGCEKFFNTKRDLEDHGRSKHGHTKLNCKVSSCSSQFNSYSGLCNHMKKIHLDLVS